MKKGFTLSEMLLVITIIGILSIIVIPSVIVIRNNINKRQYENKIVSIKNAAELYASEHPDIFEDSKTVTLYVSQLLSEGYLNSEVDKNSTEECTTSTADVKGFTTDGCIMDPVNNKSMNDYEITITKENIGYSTEVDYSIDTNNKLLVNAVCDYLENGTLIGQASYNNTKYKCKCSTSSGKVSELYAYDSSGNRVGKVNACIISGYTKYNFLKHENVMYRVLGLYDLNTYTDENGNVQSNTGLGISAKLITNDAVDIN